jgi:hypothetical protein
MRRGEGWIKLQRLLTCEPRPFTCVRWSRLQRGHPLGEDLMRLQQLLESRALLRFPRQSPERHPLEVLDQRQHLIGRFPTDLFVYGLISIDHFLPEDVFRGGSRHAPIVREMKAAGAGVEKSV